MASNYCVAVFGGAVAGSEAVEQMTAKGIHVVVFDQNKLPYGKIESGLPKWHIKLRDKQEQKIDQKLDHPLVHYVPNCKLGRDISFSEITRSWGFNAVLLATGAWRDRPLPVPGIEKFLGKGFYYQNPFVQWFNSSHDPAYNGPQFEIQDNAVIIGGGLASIDVAKILMIESFINAVTGLGKAIDTITVERLGLKAATEHLGVNLSELSLKGCTIYYRRRIVDMPLSSDPQSDDPDELKKVQTVREKIVNLAREKFMFNLVDCHSPAELILENDKLKGLIFQKNKIENGRAVAIEGSLKRVITPLIISSIGSIPEMIEGIKGSSEKFDIEDAASGKLAGYKNVFALGNAITGKGNIKESQQHGRKVSESIIRDYLGVDQQEHESDYDFKNEITEQLKPVTQFVEQSDALSNDVFNTIMQNVKKLQLKAGYSGDYKKWIIDHLPARMEQMTTL